MKIFQKLFIPVISRLERELPSGLFYHNTAHTRDVVRVAEQIALAEKVSEDDLETLLLAALFHDTGFLKGYDDHEEHSCGIAIEYLTHEPVQPAQVRQICELIKATKIPQQPGSHLARILCDSDLDYLGRDDYFEIAERLYHELVHFSRLSSKAGWIQKQISFLESHTYFTSYSQENRAVPKHKHLVMLRSMTVVPD